MADSNEISMIKLKDSSRFLYNLRGAINNQLKKEIVENLGCVELKP